VCPIGKLSLPLSKFLEMATNIKAGLYQPPFTEGDENLSYMLVYIDEKLKKIDRVPTSLKELIDVDSSTGITRCVDCISNGMILVASVSEIYKRDTFVFKHLTDIIKVGQGIQATLTNGIMTLSSSLESLNLNDLLDVSITNPADDDVLTYNSILQRWENTASGWVPTSRTISINGVIQDLSANRSWTISAGTGTVTSVTGTGTVSGLTLSGTGTTAVTLTLGGVIVLQHLL